MITADYFTHPSLKIPGIDDTINDQPTDSANQIVIELTEYINEYEPKYIDELTDRTITADDCPSEVKDVLYCNNGTSPIAQYIFFQYMRDNVTISTMAGEKIKNIEYSTSVLSNGKVIRAWNKMVATSHRIADTLGIRSRDSDIFHEINSFGL